MSAITKPISPEIQSRLPAVALELGSPSAERLWQLKSGSQATIAAEHPAEPAGDHPSQHSSGIATSPSVRQPSDATPSGFWTSR